MKQNVLDVKVERRMFDSSDHIAVVEKLRKKWKFKRNGRKEIKELIVK